MHLGVQAPRCLRPDFSTENNSWADALPRIMVLHCANNIGSLVTPWNNLVVNSSVYEVADDGQSINYRWEHEDLPDQHWDLQCTIEERMSAGQPIGQTLAYRFTFTYGGVEIATQKRQGFGIFWNVKYPNRIWLLVLQLGWTKTVPDALFRGAEPYVGSADWERNQPYQPYRTRPE